MKKGLLTVCGSLVIRHTVHLIWDVIRAPVNGPFYILVGVMKEYKEYTQLDSK